ncbi:MAG: potassium transporter TrkH [Candidatus Delongbacteria bacterium]|nr:potassium transporter TrkH [Candidatus Delongbacteria bacterium]MBN2835457.1 potassium transporter TrkH [Candidatus Delongbacteria bacterium]
MKLSSRFKLQFNRSSLNIIFLIFYPLLCFFIIPDKFDLENSAQILVYSSGFLIWVLGFTSILREKRSALFYFIIFSGFSTYLNYDILIKSQILSLFGIIGFLSLAFILWDFPYSNRDDEYDEIVQININAKLATFTTAIVFFTISRFIDFETLSEKVLIISSFIISHCYHIIWIIRSFKWRRVILYLLFILIGVFLYIDLNLFIISLITVNLLSFMEVRRAEWLKDNNNFFEILINHPARMLITSFVILCLIGSILLITPFSSANGVGISLIDAVFTSVSAVCVTGLIVLDTPVDFSFFGQLSIITLIQLGGLGIMGIGTVMLHLLGRRISLKHEKVLTSITESSSNELLQSFYIILKYTFIIEITGAILLSLLFYNNSEDIGDSIWKGVFTSISAFCNAGFALQSDSLIPFTNNPLILHIISALIILGGIAPAIGIMIPRWIRGKRIPVTAYIALNITVLLLIIGFLSFTIFEWNGVMKDLSFLDKLHNGWFQSVTLRTAGFNSVDLTHVSSNSYIIMLILMFIGGSPGGTAGGVKTTVVGVIILIFWTIIMNKNDLVVNQRRIRPITIYRSITILIAGMLSNFIIIMMLLATQQIPVRDLVFEAVSAIGTVGLSIGATPMLDEIGKVIIVFAMFLGRIGPLTLFMLLSEDLNTNNSRYPETIISLT